MRSLPPHLFRGWRAALLLAAAACWTPSTASAGCGDYVTIRSADGTADTHPPADDALAAPSAPLPCNGPGCHGSPTRDPFAPAAPPVTTAGAKECVAHALAGDPAAARPLFPFPTSEGCPGGRPASVFHPPRAN